jgi:long-chain acyl-CoA synthetase
MMQWLQKHPPLSIAIIEPESNRSISYGELAAQVNQAGNRLQETNERCLVFLDAVNTIDFIISYLACLTADFPVCLLDTNQSPESLNKLVTVYHPKLVITTNPEQNTEKYELISLLSGTSFKIYKNRATQQEVDLHKNLALLLPTSGSTGNPKLVKLTQTNIDANASAISEYLNLSPQETAIQSLPLHYSYGLSILNSHLYCGGKIVLTPHSFMRPEFWQDARSHNCTSFAGVPYMYETMQRLKFNFADHPTIKTFTQAGGGLRADIKRTFAIQAAEHNRQFFVMYGQTEATARIAYVPPARLLDKLDSIGIPIPQGELKILPVEGSEHLFELVYSGANVMMGYAESIESLAIGDTLNGQLRTGDLATVDEEGFYKLQGRLKRFAKLFGKRVSLDDVEIDVELSFNCRAAAIESLNGISIFIVGSEEIEPRAVKLHVASKLAVTPVAVIAKRLDSLPMTSSGKKDYKSLEQ